MSVEQLLIFLVLFGFAMLQLLRRALGARHIAGAEREPAEEEPFSEPDRNDEIWWPPPSAPPPAAAPVPHAVSAPKPVVPAPPARLPMVRKSEDASAGPRADLVPRNRSELRRAIALMAILGPPRALNERS